MHFRRKPAGFRYKYYVIIYRRAHESNRKPPSLLSVFGQTTAVGYYTLRVYVPASKVLPGPLPPLSFRRDGLCVCTQFIYIYTRISLPNAHVTAVSFPFWNRLRTGVKLLHTHRVYEWNNNRGRDEGFLRILRAPAAFLPGNTRRRPRAVRDAVVVG